MIDAVYSYLGIKTIIRNSWEYALHVGKTECLAGSCQQAGGQDYVSGNSKLPALRQIVRYGVVGVLNNMLGYLVYLLVTYFWVDPKVAITLLYPLGATTAYFWHSKDKCSDQGRNKYTLWRYTEAHLISYGVNYFMLYIFWEKFNFPHQIVQAAAIFVCAGVLFLLFKYFVFPPSDSGKAENP